MRKSVYYLLANTLSLVVAFIVMASLKEPCPTGFGNAVALMDWSYPLIIQVSVEALAIIYCSYDCTSNSVDNRSLKLKIFDIVGLVLTIGASFITWLALILESHAYNLNDNVAFPIFYTIFFIVGLAMILLSSFLSKKNSVLGISSIFAGLIVITAGVAYDCYSELYVLLPILAVAILIMGISLLAGKKKAHK